MGQTGESVIIPHLGHGSPEQLFIHGRVLQHKNISAATDNDMLWRNLLNTYRRLESDEVPYAQIGVLRAHEKMAWMLRSFIIENKD